MSMKLVAWDKNQAVFKLLKLLELLKAEYITQVDKNTGASNCSIGGTGKLVRPTSFSHSGQTKKNLNLAYNNRISPPGKSTNANFNVLANQSNISKIQSTTIPWSEYTDNNYLNANNCNDWTSGAFPRNISSTGNAKKNHYPDSGSNISTSCGTSGDLSSKNIDVSSNPGTSFDLRLDVAFPVDQIPIDLAWRAVRYR